MNDTLFTFCAPGLFVVPHSCSIRDLSPGAQTIPRASTTYTTGQTRKPVPPSPPPQEPKATALNDPSKPYHTIQLLIETLEIATYSLLTNRILFHPQQVANNKILKARHLALGLPRPMLPTPVHRVWSRTSRHTITALMLELRASFSSISASIEWCGW